MLQYRHEILTEGEARQVLTYTGGSAACFYAYILFGIPIMVKYFAIYRRTKLPADLAFVRNMSIGGHLVFVPTFMWI